MVFSTDPNRKPPPMGFLIYTWRMLICFDLDGTLLNSAYEVSPATRAALVQLRTNGHQLMLISSRPTRSVDRYAQSLGLGAEMHVSLGGSYLYRGGQTLFDQPADAVVCQAAAAAAERLRLHLSVYAGWQWLGNFRDAHLRQEEGIVGFTADDLRDLAANPLAANKLVMMSDGEKTHLYAAAMEEVGEFFNVNIAHPRFYELTAKGVNKSLGLRRACELLGITAAEVVAFGDGDNDVEMLKFAGVGVAMGNALPVAKQAADRVTLHHDEGGIEFMLKQLGLM